MGTAIDALSPGVKNVVENPSLVAWAFALTIISVIVTLPLGLVAGLLSFIPLVGQLIARPLLMIPLKTLLLGGMVGLAGAGFTGSVGFDRLKKTYSDHGLTLAAAFGIYEAIVVVVGIVLGVAIFVVVLGGAMSVSSLQSEMASSGLGIAVIGIYVVALLITTGIAMVFQFLDVAVVLGDKGAVEAVKECWRLVKNGPLSVLGYSILRGLLGFAVLLPAYLLIIGGGQLSTDALVMAGLALLFVLSPVALAFTVSYHAAYYGQRVQAR